MTVPDKPINRRLFWVSVLIGWVVMAYGIYGVFANRSDTAPRSLGLWFAGSGLVHDFVLVPIVLAVGALIGRVVPRPWRAPLQAGLIVTGVMALWTLPLVLRLGGASVPSVLPLDYKRSLVIVVAVIWAVTVLVAVTYRVRRARSSPPQLDEPAAP